MPRLMRVLVAASLLLCSSAATAEAPPPEVAAQGSDRCVADPAHAAASIRTSYVPQAWATRDALFLKVCRESNGDFIDSSDPTLGKRLVRAEGISARNSDDFYPPEAKKAHLAGWVDVMFVVELDGSVSNLTAVQGAEVFLDAAVAVMKTAKYRTPALLDGKPIRSLVYTRVRFG